MPKALLLLAVLLLAARLGRTQQPNDSLTTGQPLLDGQTLISAQGTFTLGFFPNGDNTYLGIWFNNMKPRTVIWVANRDAPIKGGNGSLTLSTNSLDLLDRRGNSVWSSSSFSTNSPQAFLLDSGNLVINDSMLSEAPNPLWQSFAEPCDTLLSGMTIGYDKSPTIQYMQLKSWKSVSDPSTGSYSITLDPRRRPPELLLFNDTTLLYRTGPWNGQGFSGQPYLKTTNKLAFNMSVHDDSAYYSFTSLDSSVQWRFVMSSDGLAHRWYSNPSNDAWVEYWHWPQNQCDSYARCGPNAACYNDDCRCLQEFVPKSPNDWNQRNFTGGCVRNALLSCSSANGFDRLQHVKVPDTLNAIMVGGKSLDDCKELCLKNCSCSAYALLGGSNCIVWSGDLVDVVLFVDGINDLYTRVSHNNHSHPGPSVAIIVSVSIVGVLLAISAILGFCYHRSRQKHLPLALEQDHAPGSKPAAKNLDLDGIRVATNNFANQNCIFSTRSRTIFKGTLPNFGDLAVKRLNTEVGHEELKNEVKMLARLEHPNIIRMLGSCIGNNENVICYEYMPGGSLDAVFFAEDEKSAVPDWPSRLHIMQGICEGLLYLHEHFRIIHRDIDPSNILLTECMIPKISDFGLATKLDQGQSEGNDEKFRGTRRYSAPELFYGKSYSMKSDVYSFGIVLLEIVTGCKAASFCREDTDDLPTYVRQHWTHGTAYQLKDPRMGDDAPRGEIERCIHIGVRCVQDDPTLRPLMSYIRNTLAAIHP